MMEFRPHSLCWFQIDSRDTEHKPTKFVIRRFLFPDYDQSVPQWLLWVFLPGPWLIAFSCCIPHSDGGLVCLHTLKSWLNLTQLSCLPMRNLSYKVIKEFSHGHTAGEWPKHGRMLDYWFFMWINPDAICPVGNCMDQDFLVKQLDYRISWL